MSDTMLDETQLQTLYQYAMVLSQHRDDAYDLLQSAVESYLIKVKRGTQVIECPVAYMRTLIRNRYIDHYRYRQRWQSESFEELALYDISPVDLEQVVIDSDELQGLWAQLSVEDRDILYHWAVLGYSTDEACALLDMPRGTFLSRIHRLRKRCQAMSNSLSRSQE
ncbi:RNA polymerase sigma factor [Pontibacterium sp.]|jgi:RNA polymerase sigma-70 factor (ECF subfamily)|uniref:RNA polymerase sigma factor n=1 Tax=Pontibacterium sp. TaxID=2036026 RepID=UPI00356838BE